MIVVLPNGFSIDPEEVKLVWIRTDHHQGAVHYEVVVQTDAAGAVVVGRPDDHDEAEELVRKWWKRLNLAAGEEDEGPESHPWPPPAIAELLARLERERAAARTLRPEPPPPPRRPPKLEAPFGPAWEAWKTGWRHSTEQWMQTAAVPAGAMALLPPVLTHLDEALAPIGARLDGDDPIADLVPEVLAHPMIRALASLPGGAHGRLVDALDRIRKAQEAS